MNSQKKFSKRIVHPYITANFLSRFTFFFVKALITKHFKKKINEDDLYETLPDFCSEKLGNEFETISHKYPKNDELLVLKIIFRRFAKPFAMLNLIYILSFGLMTYLEPFLMSKIVSYFKIASKDDSTFEVTLVATISLVFSYFICNLSTSYILFLARIIGIQIAVGFSSLIYRKTLRLKSSVKFDEIFRESGNIVTLITKDVLIFDNVISSFMGLLYFIACFVLVTILIYQKVGIVGLCIPIVILLIIFIQLILSKKLFSKRIKIGLDTAKRIEIIREALTAIRIIKMYTWERHFIQKISTARKIEMKGIFILYLLRFLIMVLGSISSTADLYVFIIVYVYVHKTITTETLYYVMVLLNGFRFLLNILLPFGISGLGELFAATKRIQKFLQLDESCFRNLNSEKDPKIIINGTINCPNLDISLNLEDKGLVLIMGLISSGKSTLLKTILKEYPVNGSIEINGKLSYASQEPWIFPATIKQNIIFGNDFDQVRYNKILDICALEHDLRQFDKGDEAILTDRGANLSKGQQARINLARALYHKADIYLLDDSFNSLDQRIGQMVFEKCVDFLKNRIVLIVVQNNFSLGDSYIWKVIYIQNGKANISEKTSTTKICLRKSKTNTQPIQLIYSAHENELSKENEEFETSKLILKSSINNIRDNIYHETIAAGSISFSNLREYGKHCGGYFACFIVLFVFILFEICNTLSYKFISKWLNAEDELANLKDNISIYEKQQQYSKILIERNTHFYAYNSAFILTAIFGLLRAALHFYVASRASVRIHEIMVKSVINAEVQFFDTHLLGNVLNRFAKDIYNLDENVPFYLFQVIMMNLEIIGLFVLIASTNWIFFLLACSVLILMVLILKCIFLPLVSNLKRLESAVHSPMVGYLNTSITGLDTIRVHNSQRQLQEEFDKHQDMFSSAYFNIAIAERAFGTIFDLLGCMLLFICMIYFFTNQAKVSAADVGLVISTFARTFGILNVMSRQLIEFLVYVTSVERVLEYASIKVEKSSGMELSDWPENGRIEFEQVSLTYPSNNAEALKDISFQIKEKETIGIVGRTGSGKSSLISALFRFYETQGRILIDDVDIKYLSLNYRSKIGIFPQESVIFSGSLRENLDPFHKYSDQEIWKYLKTVQLPFKHLNDDLCSLNLSSGQKQLVCLVRVLLDKKKIVILDEATSNIDEETESYIFTLLNEYLTDCTVINIAHKFSALKNVKMLVLSNGKISNNNEIDHIAS